MIARASNTSTLCELNASTPPRCVLYNFSAPAVFNGRTGFFKRKERRT